MKLSQLITKLELIKARNGDLEIVDVDNNPIMPSIMLLDENGFCAITNNRKPTHIMIGE